ncbi:hypothetical protein BCR36DRAFT_582738 [Piromyces finnis]|uniref:Uncharacterized protein n=1 Tax=Piromyces finnis TaxID=1754191 RepID=A0A1Y1VBV0_9FUNG|nr:hypothetical protein BCR36DRAFT_582738 [Piromyces finnis]|eukprot:ORX52238.1 hypothetical protein BCR36DRAFT_582738 [Piromyces finnis]
MKCFTKISLVVLSLFSLSKGAFGQTNNNNVDLNSLFSNIIGNNDVQSTKVAGVTANPTEIDDEYTQEDFRKFTKFLLNAVTPTKNVVASPTTPASDLLGEIKDLSAELDQIKERRVNEIDELIDIIKNVSSRLENLENTVEQKLSEKEANVDTVVDSKEVDLNNAEVDNINQVISPINEADIKYAAIYKALNQKNEDRIAEMQQNEIKLLEEIKGLIANNNNNNVVLDKGKAVVDKEIIVNTEEVNSAPPPETTEESMKEQINAEGEVFDQLYQDLNKDIDEYKKVVLQKSENVNSDEQFTKAAMIRDKTKSIKQYINKLASLAKNEEQKNKLKEINDKFDGVENVHIEKVNNDEEIVKDEIAAKETAEEAKNTNTDDLKNVVSIDNVKKVIDKIASSTTNEQQVGEVQRIIKEIQLNEQIQLQNEKTLAENEDDSVENALFKAASNTMNEEQVEEVRKFIKAIEANAILDSNLKKDEVIKKLIYDISANTTNEEQVKKVQRILEKIEIYNKFAEDTQQEREDNLAFGQEMAAEIVKTPDEISNDLKNLLVSLVENAKTEEEASNVANIIAQIKNHDKLIKEAEKTKEAESDIKIPNVESYIIEKEDGTTSEIFLREDYEFIPPSKIPVGKQSVKIDLEDDEEQSNGGMYILGALGVIAIAGAGFTYRSKAKKLNDEFPFSDSNLPFSSSMNGLVVDKEFLYGKTEIAKPDNIINNDAVIRPSQPSWATSVLMDENNKKGLKENITMIEDPEELLDEQLNKIQSKEKVIVKSSLPSVVITIDEDNVTTKEVPEVPKQKVKKPKLRRSIGSISLDKKIKEDREGAAEKKKSRKSKRHQKKEIPRKIKEEEELDEETEISINTSFMLEDPSSLFDEEEKTKKVLLEEKPKVPKRISSYVTECPFTDDFAKELMEDYNKKFGEMEKEN